MIYSATIRQRGQLTIPDKLRELFSWLEEGSIVGIEVEEEVLKIKPHSQVKKIDYDDFYTKMQLARSFKGKRGNLSAMIASDREAH